MTVFRNCHKRLTQTKVTRLIGWSKRRMIGTANNSSKE